MPNCLSCGSETVPNANFCGRCGVKLKVVAEAPVAGRGRHYRRRFTAQNAPCRGLPQAHPVPPQLQLAVEYGFPVFAHRLDQGKEGARDIQGIEWS